MAQLIKCHDFVSRYEIHLNRYVGQFVAKKNKRWATFQKEHESEDRHEFLDQLYKHQLIWASSTPLRKSHGSQLLKNDQRLRNLLKWFGDTSLILYQPILNIEGVEVQTDIIVLTPFTIWIVVYVEGEKGSVFQGRSKRQWSEILSEGERTLVNPLISLARSSELVRRCLNEESERLPIKPILLVPNSFVEFADPDRGVQIIDKSLFSTWIKSIEPYRAPIKNVQLKIGEMLLKAASTKAEIR